MRTPGENSMATRWGVLALTLALWLTGGLRCWADELRDCIEGATEAVFFGPGLYWAGPCSDLRRPCTTFLRSEATCRTTPDLTYSPVYLGSPPQWYASAELMPLFRDPNKSYGFQSVGQGAENVQLGTWSFDEDFESGVRLLLGRTLSDRLRIEYSYFGSHSWDDLASLNNSDENRGGGSGNMFSPFNDFGTAGAVVGQDFNSVASIAFSSTLNNAEINLRHRLLMPAGPAEASFLFGGRYMKIREDLRYFTRTADLPAPGGTPNNVRVSTDNDLVGLQIGLLGQFLTTHNSWLDFEIKGGVFNNRADQSTHYATLDDRRDEEVFTDGREEHATSFLGEVSLVFNYQLTRSFTFRLGYEAMWLTGVALAADNFNTNLDTLRVGPAQLDHTAEIVYHGPVIGLLWAR